MNARIGYLLVGQYGNPFARVKIGQKTHILGLFSRGVNRPDIVLFAYIQPFSGGFNHTEDGPHGASGFVVFGLSAGAFTAFRRGALGNGADGTGDLVELGNREFRLVIVVNWLTVGVHSGA